MYNRKPQRLRISGIFIIDARYNEHNEYYFKTNWSLFETILKLILKWHWSKMNELQTRMLWSQTADMLMAEIEDGKEAMKDLKK